MNLHTFFILFNAGNTLKNANKLYEQCFESFRFAPEALLRAAGLGYGKDPIHTEK